MAFIINLKQNKKVKQTHQATNSSAHKTITNGFLLKEKLTD